MIAVSEVKNLYPCLSLVQDKYKKLPLGCLINNALKASGDHLGSDNYFNLN